MVSTATFILGRGAVKDTYNLLADGIVQVVRALASLDRRSALGDCTAAKKAERLYCLRATTPLPV